jgi:hypothetical protein
MKVKYQLLTLDCFTSTGIIMAIRRFLLVRAYPTVASMISFRIKLKTCDLGQRIESIFLGFTAKMNPDGVLIERTHVT